MEIKRVRADIDAALRSLVQNMGEKGPLRDACEYALLSGGKRLRPILVLLIADALGKGKQVMEAALSVECFHSASLIADDLPCMDDDDERRSRPSVHKVFGESTAILASYALIAEGYGGIARAGKSDSKAALLCLEEATRCAGLRGATQGQFLDLNPADYSWERLHQIIYQKTVTLFEISWIFGWVFGGGDVARLDEVKGAAYHLGMAFQLADDLLDSQESDSLNVATVLGMDETRALFEEHLAKWQDTLSELGLWPQFKPIADWLKNYGKKSPKYLLGLFS